MNENPDVATNWKGRVLIQVICEETEKPVAKVEDIKEEIKKEANQYLRNKDYDVIAEIGQACALPKNKKYTIKMIIGGEVFETEAPRYAKKNYNRFN